MKRAASRLLPGWPELKSQGTTITTIAAAAVATLAKNKTFLLSAAAQSSTVLEDVPSVHQGLQSYSGRRTKPLAWILSQNDLQQEGTPPPPPHPLQGAKHKNLFFLRHCCRVDEATQP